LNVPIRYGTSRQEYLSQFSERLEQFADRIQPRLVLVSAGFDAHRADPVGDLGLETEDFGAIARTILDVAGRHAEGRIATVLEGGYDPIRTAECIALYVRSMLDG